MAESMIYKDIKNLDENIAENESQEYSLEIMGKRKDSRSFSFATPGKVSFMGELQHKK